MTSSRIFLKPKVRDTEMNSLNSTIICETKECEIDENEEVNDLKIIVKPKGQNSQYNYNETSSDIGNIDEHYTDSTYYDTQNAILTMRNTIKNVRSSDSSSFLDGFQDLFDKQDKIIANYNPNLKKSNSKLHYDDIYNSTSSSFGGFNPNVVYRDSKNSSRDYNETFHFNDIHENEKIPTYYNNSNIRYPSNRELNKNQKFSSRTVFEETKCFDYHDFGMSTQRSDESFSVENPRCMKRKPMPIHIDESCTYEADIESNSEKKRENKDGIYPSVRIITSKCNSPSRLNRFVGSHNSSISSSTFDSKEDEKKDKDEKFSSPYSMSQTLNNTKISKNFNENEEVPYIGDIEEFYKEEKNKREYQSNPLYTPLSTSRAPKYFNDESSIVEGELENINGIEIDLKNINNGDIYSECPSDKDSFFEKDDQMSLSGDIEDFHAISEREILNYQANKVRCSDLLILLLFFCCLYKSIH